MRWVFLALSFTIAGCVSVPQGYWHRQADSLRVDASPAVNERFRADATICDGEAAKAALASNERNPDVHRQNVSLVFEGCMVGRGYVRR